MRLAVPPGCPLTPRQYELMVLLGDGLTMKQAAQRMGISFSTARTIAWQAYGRLGVNSIAQAVIVMSRPGWLRWLPNEPDPTPVTAFQRAYLAAFDEYLASGTDAARRRMGIALMGARDEAGAPHHPRRPVEDPLDRLLRRIAGER
jgi:DNA-binding CsgD family transcriptional regulator